MVTKNRLIGVLVIGDHPATTALTLSFTRHPELANRLPPVMMSPICRASGNVINDSGALVIKMAAALAALR
jgi:hypothetical protein